MSKINALDWVAMILVIIGGLNWGLVGLFDFDLIAAIFGVVPVVAQIIYILVGLAAIYVLVALKKLMAGRGVGPTVGQ